VISFKSFLLKWRLVWQ